MVHYGIPEKLHNDQGPDFESCTIKELCQVTGIHKVRTAPYPPRGNFVERFNFTLLVGHSPDSRPQTWKVEIGY